MVAQHKITVFRHLIGELDVAFSQGKLVHVRLVQRLTVHGDNAVLIQRDHVARQADDTLEQKLVLPVKTAQVAGFHVAGLDQQNDVLVLQGGVHAVAGDLKHRQKQGGQQHRNGCNHQQGIHRATQHAEVAAAVSQPVTLCLHLGGGGDGRELDFLLFHLSHFSARSSGRNSVLW